MTVRFHEMRFGGVCLLLGTFAIASVGCGKKERMALPERRGDELVRVGEVFLTRDDLANLLPENENLPLTEEEKKRFVERWVNTELLHQEAVRRGLGDDPRVRFRLKAFEREYLADHLVYLELRDRTRVTEGEIEDYFNEHRDEYLYEYRVSHILVNTLEEAETARELLKTRSFAWVANHHSIDPVAKRGGDLGYLTKGNMIPEFEKVIFSMGAGEVSGIVKSDFGYHIIKLIGMRESLVKVGLDDVRQNIMNMLVIEKREQAYREFLDSLRASMEVEYCDTRYAPSPSSTAVDSEALKAPDDTIGVFGE